MIIVQYLDSKQAPKDGHLRNIMWRILQLLKYFEDVNFFHVPRALNSLADRKSNVVCNLRQGNLLIVKIVVPFRSSSNDSKIIIALKGE